MKLILVKSESFILILMKLYLTENLTTLFDSNYKKMAPT